MAHTDKALPIVNGNGDTAATLKANYRAAAIAIDAAIKAVAASAPHGRNYQVGDCDYSVARKEHDERLTALNEMLERMKEYYRAVYK